MQCVAKIMAMPGTRLAVADLCMFGLAACDDGGPGFVNVSVRTITNARRVGVRSQSKCASTHRHARVDCDKPTEKAEQTGSWVRQVAQAVEEQLKEDQQKLETREKKRKVEDVQRIRRNVRENNKNKDLSHVQSEMGKLMHHDEQELLSVWKDGTGMTTKVGGLIRSCAPRPGERKWRKSRGGLTCGERTSTLQHEEGCLSNWRRTHVRPAAIQLVRHMRRRTKLGGGAHVNGQ